jgi:glycosyltransferase involved in cell wall biosynthesis
VKPQGKHNLFEQNPMRILQIVPSISLVYGGPSQMVRGLSQGLAAAGADVTILTTDANGDNGQAPLDVPLGKAIAQDGYQVIHFPCRPFRRYKFSVELLQWLDRHGRDYDVIHIHALFSPISSMAAWVARRIGVPYILRPLGTLDPADLQKKKQLKQLYAALLEAPNLKGAAAVHFTSAQEAKIFPLGVTLPAPQGDARQELGLTEDWPIVLFMSRIDPKKGFDLLIPALENLVQEQLPFYFVVAGANPQDPAYEEKIRQRLLTSSLGDRTHNLGFVSGGAKTALLKAADLFVLPSYYENFGIAVAEAMHLGTPVVISDQVHIHDNVSASESGWVSDCSVEGLTQSLRQALSDPQMLERRGENAQTYAQRHYCWETIAPLMLTAYRSLVTTPTNFTPSTGNPNVIGYDGKSAME